MKKRITIFSVLMLVFVYSCRKSLMPNMDEGSAAMGKFNVNAAREHIKLLVKGEVSYDGKIALKTMSTTGTFTLNGVSQKTVKTGQKIFYPFWDRAITSNFKGKVDYVEVPIALSSRQIRLYQFPKDNIKQKPDARVAKAAFQRLVVYKDSKGGIGQRLLTYIPDKQYVMEHGYEASTNSLSKLNRDFFGYIEYKNWSGDIVSVLRIENGKVVRRYKVNKASKEQLQGLNLQRTAKSATGKVMSGGNTTSSTQEEVCDWEWIPIMETVCEVNDDGNPNDENLNEIECTLQEVGEYAAWVCTWVDVPDPEPCPWGDCGEEPCTDCENPCTDCEEPEPTEIVNNVTDTCLKKTVNLSLNNDVVGKIKDIINSLDDNANVKVKIYDAQQTVSGSAATTTGTQWKRDPVTNKVIEFSTNITLSKDLLLGSSKEHTVAVLMHEVLHAYFRQSTQKQEEFEGKDHQTMVNDYINPAASFLASLFNISLTDATALAWDGVADTDAYKNATQFTVGSGPSATTISKQDLADINTNYVLKTNGKGQGTCQ